MSTPTSQLLSPSSASPDHYQQHQCPSSGGVVEPAAGVACFSDLHAAPASTSDSHSALSSLKTEYKSKFTPFDQYVYNELTDSFVRPPSASPVAPSLTDHLLLTPGGGGGSPDAHHQQPADLCSRASSTEQPVAATEPWYKEVQRRNEKANEYRFKSEVGHSSATQTHPHCREDYKRDHLISHLANNNNFNLPKDTSSTSAASRTANQASHASSARSATRTPAQVRSKSQSTVRRTHHQAPSTATTTTTNHTTSKNLNLTPTRAPERHPVARPSPHLTSSTTRTPKSYQSPLDTRSKPLNASASSRTATRLASATHHQENRVTSTTGHLPHSSINNKQPQRPATGTLRVSVAPRHSSRQPISSSSSSGSGTTTAQQRNNVSSASSSSRTPTTAQRLSHAKTGTNRTPTSSSTPTPAVKSIKTPQAVGAASAAAAAAAAVAVTATTASVIATSTDDTPQSQSTEFKDAAIVKKEPEEDVVSQKRPIEELTSSPAPQEPRLELEPTTAVKLEPKDNNWISSRNSSEIADPPTNFMFSNTETGNMLADELAEAELRRQKADAFNALSDDQSYQTNDSEGPQKSTEEFSQAPSKDDEENQMYSIMPVVGGAISSVSKGPALEPMSESLESNNQSTEPETELKEMPPTESKDGELVATEDPSEPEATEQNQEKEVELDDDDVILVPKEDVVEATNQSVDEVESNHNEQDAIKVDLETIQTAVDTTRAVVPEQEELGKPTPEVEETSRESAAELARQESEISAGGKIEMEEQSRTEDDLNKLLDEDVNTDTKVALHKEREEEEQEHNLLAENATLTPLPSVMSEGSQMLDQLSHDSASGEPGDHSNESQNKEALDEEVIDTLVENEPRGEKIEEPVVEERQLKTELLMDVNNLLDEEARKKLEMSKRSELARKSSSPLTDVGEVLLSPTQLDLGSQEDLKQGKFLEEEPTLESAKDQVVDIISQDRVEEVDLLVEKEPQEEGSQSGASGQMDLLTTPKNSVETLTLDDNTLLGDTSNDWKQQNQETNDERERSVGDEIPEENMSALRDTEERPILDVNTLTEFDSTGLAETTAVVDETVDDLAKVTDELTEPIKSEEAIKSSEMIVEQESADKEETKNEIKIDSSGDILDFSGPDLSPDLTQNGLASNENIASTEEDSKVKGDITSSSSEEVQQTTPDDSNVVPEVTSVGTSRKNSVDDSVSDEIKLETGSPGAGKDDHTAAVAELDEDINKFTLESKSSGVFEDHFNAADSGELDLMKQINMDSGYVNNKNSDDETALAEPTKTKPIEEKLDETNNVSKVVSNFAPLADINSDSAANQIEDEGEAEEAHGELYRQLNINPKERKVSLDMDKNTLRRKLSSRSSSSTSSSHASSSASSSLERVVQNDIKSDYEELAARMTTDLIASGNGDATMPASVTGDLLAGNSANISQSSSEAKVTAHQQLAADGATATTNLLD